MPENTEIQKLHETVKKAVNIWQKMQPSTAQAKADKEQEREVTEKQEENLKEEEKQREHRRKLNLNIFSMAKGLVSGVKNTFNEVRQHFSRATSFVIGHVREVLGPVAEAFDFTKNIFMGMFATAKNIFGFFFRGIPKWAGEQIMLLASILEYFHRQEKREALKGRGTTRSRIGELGIIGIVAVIIGMLVRKIIAPLELLFRSFRIGAALRRLRVYFRLARRILSRRFPEFMKRLLGFFSMFKEGGKIFRFFSAVMARVPLLAKFFSALKIGFKIFGWPLTILLGVIDFIKGFMRTEGDIVDKIMGGFKAAIMGFVGIFLDIAGWIVEKGASLLGIQLDNVGGKLREWFENALEWSPLGMIYNVYKMIRDGNFAEKFAGIKDKIKFIGNAFLMGLVDMFETVREIITGAKDWVVDKLKFWNWGDNEEETTDTGVPWYKRMFGRGNEAEESPNEEAANAVSDMARAEATTKLTEDQMQSLTSHLDLLTGQIITALAQSMQGMNRNMTNVAMASRGRGGRDVEAKQIPDEIDNNIVTVRNLSMEMGD